MLDERYEQLRTMAQDVGHRITGQSWTARDEAPDRQGVFDTQDYVVIGIDRAEGRHYEKQEEFGDAELHRYIASFDPGTVLGLLRDLEASNASRNDLESQVEDLEDEAKGWESWEAVQHDDLSMKHLNRRVEVRKANKDRLVGTLTQVGAARREGLFENLSDLTLSITVAVAGASVQVQLFESDSVQIGPAIDLS